VYFDGVFSVSSSCGFLPIAPLPTLPPSPFDESVGVLLSQLPVHLCADDSYKGNSKGILGCPSAIVHAIANLPNLVDAIVPAYSPRTIATLFRSYAFLASAYLLETAYATQTPEGKYGKARRILPKQIAQPLHRVAKALGQAPWLDYHYAYGLCNYAKKDEQKGLDYNNLDMVCRFAGTQDEVGFMMVHVNINENGAQLIAGIRDAIAAAEEDPQSLVPALAKVHAAATAINSVRRSMWKASKPERYNDFRAFIMGVKGNDAIFGDGVIYEGVDEYGNEPQQPRGQTGAQDDLIPTLDIFSGVTEYYPTNKLTEYLIDLRTYRPTSIKRFLEDLRERVRACSLAQAVRTHPSAAATMVGIVEEIFLFRNGHFQFVQRYIMANTQHGSATGGTPITTWLPNQLEACLKLIDDLLRCDSLAMATSIVNAMAKSSSTEGIEDEESEAMLQAVMSAVPDLSKEEASIVMRNALETANRARVLQSQVDAMVASNHIDSALIYRLNDGRLDETSHYHLKSRSTTAAAA